MRLWAEPEATILEIEDDGTGILWEPPSQDTPRSDAPRHFGLRIMKERAEAMGGQLSLRSTPSQGTQLQVTVGAPNAQDSFAISTASKGR